MCKEDSYTTDWIDEVEKQYLNSMVLTVQNLGE